MSYAEATTVPFERSVSEIVGLLKKAGAAQIAQMDDDEFYAVQFKLGDRLIRFRLPLCTTYVGPAKGGNGKVIDAAARIAQTTECGFITNDRWGFTIGYSPDALVGNDGLLEIKSRRQKFQVQTIVENLTGGTAPDDFILQCQTGLLVSEREWLDFISYSGGMPMAIIRVWPDDAIQGAIIEAAAAAEAKIAEIIQTYHAAVVDLIPTERRVEQEMYV